MSTSRDHLRTAIAALESQRAILGEAIARDTDTTPQVPNAIDGQARALLRGDGRAAKRLCDRLCDEAGDGVPRYAGTYEHLLRLTLYLADAHVGAATAEARLNEAHATLVAEADAITDAELKDSFLDRVAEHREIVTRFRSRAS